MKTTYTMNYPSADDSLVDYVLYEESSTDGFKKMHTMNGKHYIAPINSYGMWEQIKGDNSESYWKNHFMNLQRLF